MNKYIFTVCFLMFSSTAFAYKWIDQKSDGTFNGECDGGGFFAGSVGTDGLYVVTGPSGTHNSKSRHDSISKSCSQKKKENTSKLIHLKKDAVMFKKLNGEKGIISALSKESNYKVAKAMFNFSDEHGFKLLNEGHFIILKIYAKNSNVIDNYYQIKDKGGNVYYVREQDSI